MARYVIKLHSVLNLALTFCNIGSSLHAMKVLTHPRWEDFEYEYTNGNLTGWIGNGWTMDEKNKTVNVNYLNHDQIDFPPSSPGSEGARV